MTIPTGGLQLMLDPTSRDVIFSIKPEFADQILEGIKTVELRRRFTNVAPIGARAFIYSSRPVKAMVGYATISDVRRLHVSEIWKEYADKAGISHEAFNAYFRGVTHGYVIALCDPKRLQPVATINHLRDQFGFRAPQSYRFAGAEYRALIL
jgi:predicted transcriptional regulator